MSHHPDRRDLRHAEAAACEALVVENEAAAVPEQNLHAIDAT
jgi:hypothetical protein